MPTEHARTPKQFVTIAFVLVGLATEAAALALTAPGHSIAGQLVVGLILLAVSASTYAFLRRRSADETSPSLATIGVTAALLVGLWGIDLGWQFAYSGGLPYELVLLMFTRDAALAAVALGGNPVCLRLSGGLSLAAVLFASVLTEQRLMSPLLAAFSLLGSYWLILLYWSLIEVKLLEGRSGRPPVLAIAVGGLLVGLTTVLIVGPRQTLGVLAELVGTSGGTRFTDPNARGGVGDGPNLVRGEENARSSGPVDSEVFLETLERSLYDASNEKWGEPEKPVKREHSPAVAVESAPSESRTERSKQSNPAREFSVVRKRRRHAGAPPTVQADAAYFIKGKTPLHIRQAAFEVFDGRRWLEPNLMRESVHLGMGFGGWLCLPPLESPVLAGDVDHRVVVGRVDSRIVPLPSYAERFFIDRVNRPDFFALPQPGVVTFRGEHGLPRQTVLDVRSHTIDPARLRALPIPASRTYALPRFVDLDVEADLHGARDPAAASRVAALAREWTQGVPRGWPQIEAVVARLRADYRYTPQSALPEDSPDPVSTFLFDHRAGDDYAFATAACLLLRSLDYPCRFVEGLYARADRLDAASKHTPVRIPDDLHTWVEVMLPGRDWIVVEPTPGFDVLGPERSFFGQVAAQFTHALGRLRAHPLALAFALATLAAAGASRRRIASALVVLVWRIECRGEPRRRILATLRLLERRARIAGRRRPAGSTLRSWYRSLAANADETTRRAVDDLLRMADWALYSPSAGRACATWRSDEVGQRCHAFARVRALDWLSPPRRNAGTRGTAARVLRGVIAAGLLVTALTAECRAQTSAAPPGEPVSTAPPTGPTAPSSEAPAPVSPEAHAKPAQPAASRPAKRAGALRHRDIIPLEDLSTGERINELIMGAVTATWFFVVGAAIGSFLNVVVYRTPRGIPVWGRKSHCPACGSTLTFRENMPIVGWLRLRGRCRSCSQRIPARYPLVELATGLIFLALMQVELLSGGKSVPIRPPNVYAGLVWVIWYPKWDLIALYGYHLFLLCTLLSAALIAHDGKRVPLRLWFLACFVGALLPAAMPVVHPAALVVPRPRWFENLGVPAGALLESLIGAVVGLLAGALLSPPRPERTSRVDVPAALGLVGVYLGWQAAVSVSLATALLRTLSYGLLRRATAERLAVAWVLIATLAQILLWRRLEGLSFWPSHTSNALVYAGCAAFIVVAGVLARLGKSTGVSGTDACTSPPTEAVAEVQPALDTDAASGGDPLSNA